MKLFSALPIITLNFCLLLFSCDSLKSNSDNVINAENAAPQKEEEPMPEKMDITYHILKMKDSGMKMMRKNYEVPQQAIILALNRVDRDHVSGLDSIVVPDTMLANLMQYSPFPYEVPALKDVQKIIYFSYHDQAFAAYENGRFVKWGPSNMGREDAQTPRGVYYANWKGEEVQSTVDDEWILKWNFNIANKEGIGWHQYSLPGYPASHSCLRLREEDAKYLYDWAEQWVLKGTDNILAKGTPTIVFGEYPFKGEKPWMALARNPKALDLTPQMMEEALNGKLQEILANQKKLDEETASNPPTEKAP